MKQAILIRKDLKLPKGKMAGQAAHAAVEAAQRSTKQNVQDWRKEGAMKIVLYVDDEKHLYECKTSSDEIGLATAVITDAGKTVIAPGTVTCMAIGPDEDEKVDRITGKLKLV